MTADPQIERAPASEPPADESIDLGRSGITEIRVHGVSGSPPEQALDHPLLRRVAGDGRAGFYRRWYPGGRSADLRGPRRLEAYSWGGLTSGGAGRALWLLLLPFMLANLAYWMLPAVPDDAGPTRLRAARASAALLRVFGLALTLTLVLTGVQVAVDVVGWQCGGDPRCVEQARVLGALGSGVLANPGRRIVLTALFPLLLIAVVGFLGRQTVRKTAPTPNPVVTRVSEEPLADPAFWRGNPGMPVLRTTHVAAAASVLAALVAWPATSLVATGTARVIGMVLCIASTAVLALCVVLVAGERATGREATHTRRVLSPVGANVLRRAAIVLLALAAIYSAWDWPEDWAFAGRLPGLREAILGCFCVTVIVLLALTATVAAQRPWAQNTADGYRAAVRGLAAPTTAAMAFLVAGGFSAGLTYRIAELFGRPVLSEETRVEELAVREATIADSAASFDQRLAAATGDAPLTIPPSFAWAGAATTVIALVLLVIAIATVVRVRRRVRVLAEAVLTSRPAEAAGRTATDREVRRVARTEAIAALGDDIGRFVGRLVAASAVVLLAGAAFYAAAQDNWQFVEEPPLSTATRIGTWLMGAFTAGTIAVFWASYRNPTMRRTVGVLWDVGCFFPRAAHPLSPASYGERAIPDLAERTGRLTDSGRVLLSGHSQGSVLVAATVLQLPPSALERVRLITHGSPLRRLYARFFPAYLGATTLVAVRTAMRGGWRSLYRATDPIGAWVLEGVPHPTGGVDRFLIDPATLGAPIRGHMDYWGDTEYEPIVVDLLAEPADRSAPSPPAG